MNFNHRFSHGAASIFFVLASLAAAPAFGQGANDGFDPNINGTVFNILVQSDGKILVGGHFTSVGGTSLINLVRLNSDGTADPSFAQAEPNDLVRVIAKQSGGKILVGGWFTSWSGQPRSALARLFPDGTLDPSFHPVIVGVPQVIAILVLPDEKILVGGAFTSVDGHAHANLVRLNADGTVDGTFTTGANESVWYMKPQPDGKIVINGSFTAVNGQAHQYIARLNADGTLDAAFNPFAGDLWTVAVQPDGKVLASAQGLNGGFLTRLNGDGSTDTTFRVTFRNDDRFNDITPLRGLTVQPDGNILVGGSFTNANGELMTNIVRFLPDGSIDPTFKSPAGSGGEVRTLVVQADGKILVGGSLNLLGGTPRHGMARLYPDGSLDTTFAPAPDLVIYGLAVQPDYNIIAVGPFGAVNGQPRSRIGRLKPDGSLDGSFNPGATGYSVFAVAEQNDGKTIVAGEFSTLAGQPRSNIGRLNADGTLDNSFHPGADSTIVSMAVQADGKILVGGTFTTLGGQPRARIGRLDAGGSVDDAFNPGVQGTSEFDPVVSSLAVQPDGKILVGGLFNSLGGQARTNLGRLMSDGSVDATFTSEAYHASCPRCSAVNVLAVQADGKILVGGYFTTLAGQTRSHLGRLNADGSLDAAFNPAPDGQVFSLGLRSDARILVGGFFTTLSGLPRRYLGQLNADGTLVDAFNPSPNNPLLSLALQADGKIIASGTFTNLAGQPRYLVGRLVSSAAAVQSLDINASGTTATWTRSGSGPEVEQVTFEHSADGRDFTLLGSATRVPGAWQLTGLLLPAGQTFLLRARGRTTSGNRNASSGLVESVAQFYRLAPPFISAPAVPGNGVIQFRLTNATAAAFVVLATSAVASTSPDWEVLGPPTPLGGGLYQFVDPAATNSPRRFYQLRSP